jgi:exopolysaccharide biosynthesis predicted pyruvyltransferase EpsI
VYLPSAGNAGDGLIGLGALHYLKKLGLRPIVKYGLGQEVLDGETDVIVGGGGGWYEGLWEHYAKMLEPFLQKGGRALILPTTVFGFERYLARYGSQLTIFARDIETLRRLEAVPELVGRVHLSHDLAFAVDVVDAFGDVPYEPGFPILRIMRSDPEATSEAGGFDLPMLFNGVQWGSEERCRGPLRAIANTMLQFRMVQTNRLHMGVLAALLGLEVEFHPNSYFKNKAVFETTMKVFPNVRWAE